RDGPQRSSKPATFCSNGSDAMRNSADLVHLSILAQALGAIAGEMGANLTRSSFSTVIREARDCSTAILSPAGEGIAQSALIPMQTVALSEAVKAAAATIDLHRLRADQAILLNDPYHGGQHLNDLILLQPVFSGDVLLAFVGCTAHHIDVGGSDPGI